MSLFSVGNAGFALGLIDYLLVLVFGLSGTLALVVFPLAAARCSRRGRSAACAGSRRPGRPRRRAPARTTGARSTGSAG